MPNWTLYEGDCLEVMRQLPSESVDAVVTDPPYELGFMGKKWDSSGIAYNVDVWRETLRLLKPGGHLLAFGGTRTYHRMTCAIEDAGFEIRDCIQWLYGSGFPKSIDVSKAIDKKAGVERKIVGISDKQPAGFIRHGRTDEEVFLGTDKRRQPDYITIPTTPEAKQWQGWGTALKPANEPIVLARKPLSERTIAANVLKWGTGGLNIDGCRIGTDTITSRPSNMSNNNHYAQDKWTKSNPVGELKTYTGRFPANVLLDEEAAAMLDEQSGVLKSGGGNKRNTKPNMFRARIQHRDEHPDYSTDTGGASRFFYCAKASKSERGEGNNHPTVKPLALMRYLVRLVTPPGGTVLDPFAGSGTTLQASVLEGFLCVGIELSPAYCAIIRKRMSKVQQPLMAMV